MTPSSRQKNTKISLKDLNASELFYHVHVAILKNCEGKGRFC